MKQLAALLLLALALPAGAADVKIEGELSVPQNSYADLSIKAEAGDVVIWKVFPAPVKRTSYGAGYLQFSGLPGRSYLADVTVINFDKKKADTAQVEVRFMGTPGPNPPPNPPPDPPPDEPVDGSAFVTALRAALAKEPADQKPLMENLVAFYADARRIVKVGDTWGTLYQEMQGLATDKGTAGKLQSVQSVIAAELKRVLPWQGASETPIDAAGRTKARNLFHRIALDLDKLTTD